MDTPGCTRASSSASLSSTIAAMRVSTSTIPPRSATVAAQRFDPAPRGITGTPRAVASVRISETSRVLPGNTTASGVPLNSGVASRA
ncbi:hypothetical protein BA062_22505 [Prauserella flavalba]|uniref:Uncharacterized protein n=1 Tax=Prauserella flavalba TaxID=1477506 RepID=A0A318LUG5_9PSEU|nr:hypothetical protein BA062_22505 [Prauserella flavalba]